MDKQLLAVIAMLTVVLLVFVFSVGSSVLKTLAYFKYVFG